MITPNDYTEECVKLAEEKTMNNDYAQPQQSNFNDKVRQWGHDKQITGPSGKGTLMGQANKMMEEALETYGAAFAINEFRSAGHPIPKVLWNKLVDGNGDTQVTLILLAELMGTTSEACLQFAYDEIKGRTGEMKDGTFVKDN